MTTQVLSVVLAVVALELVGGNAATMGPMLGLETRKIGRLLKRDGS